MTKSNCHQSRKAVCRFCSCRPGGSAETERPSGVLSVRAFQPSLVKVLLWQTIAGGDKGDPGLQNWTMLRDIGSGS